MTVTPHGSNVPTLPEGFDDGLGDFDESDAAVPRLTIVHKEAVFKESLSGVKYPTLDIIILGLVKQRTLWSPDVEEGERPLCKSPDFENGFPSLGEKKDFPWQQSGFDINKYKSSDGLQVILPCVQCPLKEWKSHPNGKTPWCSEEFTLPVLYDSNGEGNYMPAILTIKKSGLKNLKAYLASFQRQRMPGFSVITRVTLRQESRGQTDYCVPEWSAGERTDGEDWEGFSTSYKSLKEFLQQPPSVYDEDGNRVDRDGDGATGAAPPQTAAAAPVAAPQTAAARPAQRPAAAAAAAPAAAAPEVVEAEVVSEADDDDELPF